MTILFCDVTPCSLSTYVRTSWKQTDDSISMTEGTALKMEAQPLRDMRNNSNKKLTQLGTTNTVLNFRQNLDFPYLFFLIAILLDEKGKN